MTVRFARLALRKERPLFFGVGAVLLASVPAAIWFARRYALGVESALSGTVLFWLAAGLPAAAAAMGAAAGAELRSAGAEAAESQLPVSPVERAWGTFAAAGLHLAILYGLVAAFGFGCDKVSFVNMVAFIPSGSFDWSRPDAASPLMVPMAVLACFASALALLESLACAYWFRHGILGAAAGLVGGLATAACLALGVVFADVYEFRAPFGVAPIACGTAAAAAGAALLAWNAERIQRLRPRSWRTEAAAAFLLLAGPAVSAGALGGVVAGVRGGERLVRLGRGYFGREWGIGRYPLPAARARELEAALVGDINGSLLRVTPDGTRTLLIAGEQRTLGGLLSRKFWDPTSSLAYDARGRLWVQKWPTASEGGRFRVYGGEPEAELKLRFRPERFSYRFAFRGTELGLLSFRAETKDMEFGSFPAEGGNIAWSSVGMHKEEERLLDAWVAEGLFAKIGPSLESVTRGGDRPGAKAWRLPALAPRYEGVGKYLPLRRVGGASGFFVTVHRQDKTHALAFLEERGAVRLAWEGEFDCPLDWEETPSGGHYAWDRGRLLAVAPSGRFLPPVDLSGILREFAGRRSARRRGPTVLDLAEDRVWLLFRNEWLVEAELSSGAALKRTRLPEARRITASSERVVHAANGGFFFNADDGLYFVGLNGRARRL